MRSFFTALAALALAACTAAPPRPSTPTAVVGVAAEQLDADYWIRRQAKPQRLILDAGAIAAQNARLAAQDASVHELETLPGLLPQAQVLQWLSSVSSRPTRPLYDEHDALLAPAAIDAVVAAAALDGVAVQVPRRLGMVVARADLRAFPTRQRVFSTPGDHDIDRWQESALFPGTPVAILHESRDGAWWFVLSPLYAAWIEKKYVAEGDAAAIFDYTRKTPFLVVSGSRVRTVYTPQRPEVSELALEMGVRLPLLTGWPAQQPVNGQHAYTSHVIELPLRDAAGRLQFVPALLPRTADVATGYLPLTSANLLRQGFKFLGERYGWGHSYDARDCSGFVSEVYRSFGVILPRNTRDMGTSTALNRIALDAGTGHAARLALLRDTRPGDLLFIPGHVMMVIGHMDGEPYVIHDTTGISYADASGTTLRADLNAVAVTPLLPLLAGGTTYVDRLYSIQRIRP